MADRTLRDAERHWQSDTLAEQVAALQHAVRSGAIAGERVTLAAALGVEAARELLGSAAPDREECLARLAYAAVTHAGADKREVGVRFALASAAPHLANPPEFPERVAEWGTFSLGLRDAVENWVTAPSKATRKRVIKSRRLLDRWSHRLSKLRREACRTREESKSWDEAWSAQWGSRDLARFGWGACAVHRASHAVTTGNELEIAQVTANGVRDAAGAPTHLGGFHAYNLPGYVTRPEPDWEGTRVLDPRLRATVARELGEWALGVSDAVATRVEQRRAQS